MSIAGLSDHEGNEDLTNWAKHMDPNTTMTVKFKTKVVVSNVSLGVSVNEPLHRTSFMVKMREKGPFYNVCSFLPGRVENHHCNLTFFPDKEYQLKVCGDNPVDLLGYEAIVSVESSVGSDAEEEANEEVDEEEEEECEKPAPLGRTRSTRSVAATGSGQRRGRGVSPTDEKGKKPQAGGGAGAKRVAAASSSTKAAPGVPGKIAASSKAAAPGPPGKTAGPSNSKRGTRS